jgi:ABC-type transport system involved in multi-copper enzyme maturation permease subunit
LLLVSRRAALAIPEIVGEGVMLPIGLVAAAFAIFGVLGGLVVQEPRAMLQSLPRFLATGRQQQQFQIPPGSVAPEAIPITLRGSELWSLNIDSDQPLLISAESEEAEERTVTVEPGTSFEWGRRAEAVSPFGEEPIEQLYVTNLSGAGATLSMDVFTRPVYAEMSTVLIAALSVVGIYLLYLAQHVLAPKVSAIAVSTAKSEMAQPLFMINLAVGAFLLFVFMFIPYNTFGEDIKMLKDSGFTLIMVLSIIQAVWGASKSIAEEIDGKTALTVLSKPIGRRQFILGKFLGIVWSVAVVFIVLGAFFLILIAYKPVYDARESSKLAPMWQESYREVVLTVPGLVLAFLETVVLTAISVAISTKLPLLANFTICFAIYVLGHLTPLLVQSSVGRFEPVMFIGTLIATILPVLDHFNIQAAIAAGVAVPYDYLASALLYCIVYSAIAMLLALVLFEDRDLA